MRARRQDLALAAGGYALSVLAASGASLLLAGAAILLSSGSIELRLLMNLPGIFATTFVITACTAWPGFIATLAIARWRGWGSVLYFCIGGAATSALAALLLIAVARDPFLTKGILGYPPIYVGGLAGGLAYALFDRRFRVFR